MDTLYTLIENGVLELGNVFESCIRWVGWNLITLLAKLVNGIEKTANKVYTLNGFFNSSEVNQLIERYEPIVWTILAISIGILGFKIIFNRQQNRNELPSNILFSILVVVLLSTFMTKMNNITKFAIDTLNKPNQSITDTLVKESLYDIYYLDDNNFNLEGEKNKISANSIYNIDINEALESKEVKDSDLFKKKIVFNENGDRKLVKLEKGWFSIDEMYYRYNIDFIPVIISLGAIGIAFVCIMLKVSIDEMYYRYNIDFIPVIISLGAIGIAFVCIMLKVIRLLFELAFNKFFVTLLAFTDISDGKKLKEMVKHIIAIFIVIFITAVLTNMYMLYNSWLTKSLVSNDLGDNGVLKILFIVGGAIAVVDGPNLVERILGIDAGLKSSWGTLMAGYGVAKGALNGGKALVSGMSKLGNGLVLGMASTGGAISGMFGGKDRNNNSNNNASDSKKLGDNTSASHIKNNSNVKNSNPYKDNNKFSNLNGENVQEEKAASKNNRANLSAINDKFKEIDELRSNPNKEFSTKNNNSYKEKGIDSQTVQDQMKSNRSKLDNSNGASAKENIFDKEPKSNSNLGDKTNSAISNNSGRKEVTGKMEDRTVGQYMKDRVQGSRFVDGVNRAYSLGYNTTSKWDVKNRSKNKKGGNK